MWHWIEVGNLLLVGVQRLFHHYDSYGVTMKSTRSVCSLTVAGLLV